MADRVALTDIFLRKMRLPEKRQSDFWDGKVPGFGVRVTSTGTKTFVVMYRANGRQRRMALGRYPDISLQKARGLAQAALSKVAQGLDPQAKKDRDPEHPKDLTLFIAVVDEFVETHCKQRNRASTAAETERLLRRVFVPKWKKFTLGEIRKHDVLRVTDEIVKGGRPSAANHAFAAIRKFFNWCVERGLLEVSPCLGIRRPAKNNSRDRVLTDTELSTLWSASGIQGYPFGIIFKLLALTAQRRGEVVGMHWSELDLSEGLWTIPGARTKNGSPHLVPLTPMAVDILQNLPQFSTDLVFPAKGKLDRPYSGYSKGKRTLNANADLFDWTLHDLRRTAATGMAKLGVMPHVVERVLNHSSGTFGGVAGIYNRFGYLKEMREAIELWEDHLRRSGICDANICVT